MTPLQGSPIYLYKKPFMPVSHRHPGAKCANMVDRMDRMYGGVSPHGHDPNCGGIGGQFTVLGKSVFFQSLTCPSYSTFDLSSFGEVYMAMNALTTL